MMAPHKKQITTKEMLILFSVIFFCEAVNGQDPPPCPENPTICIIEFLKTWEELRVSEKNATNVLLPVMYYSKPSLINLCESYSDVAEKCLLGKCHVENPVASFVQRHFSFVCRKEVAGKFFDNQQCITSSLMASSCTEKINEQPKIGGEIFCPKLDEFVTCVEEPLRTSCGNEAYALVMKTVEKYGCASKIEVARVNEFLSLGVESTTMVVENSATIATVPIMETTVDTTVDRTIESTSDTTEETTVESTVGTTAETTMEIKKVELEMLVTTSLNVDDQKTTPSELVKEVVSSTELPREEKETSEASTAVPLSTIAIDETTSTSEDKIIIDEVKESSGEAPEEPTESSKIPEQIEKKRAKRKRFNAVNMTDCYTSIVGDFGRFLHSSPTSSFVRFPLFGIKPMELEVLCAKFDVATECVSSFCVGNCRLPPIKSFVDSQLKEACSVRDMSDFEMEYTCLQNVLKDNTDCVSFLNSTNPNRCDGHPQFRSCIIERLLGDCSEETVKLMDRLSSGFGCKLLAELELEEPEASGDFLEGSGSGDVPNSVEMVPSTQGNQTDEPLLTEEIDPRPKTCEGFVKTSALSCLAPLLRLWTGIKENRKDTEVVFPIFEFSKVELLELCDAFANYRNCVKFTDSGVCRMEPVINFTEEHFGQVCTSQQIEASMRTHDCINAIDTRDMATCQKYSRGETLPGKRKCTKVRRYTKCLRKLVAEQCGYLMLAQFDMIVHRFGC